MFYFGFPFRGNIVCAEEYCPTGLIGPYRYYRYNNLEQCCGRFFSGKSFQISGVSVRETTSIVFKIYTRKKQNLRKTQIHVFYLLFLM